MKQIKAQLIANTLKAEYKREIILNANLTPPYDGYMVNILSGPGFSKGGSIDAMDISSFICKHISMDYNYYFGITKDERTKEYAVNLYFNFHDVGLAKIRAVHYNQTAIWDVANAKDIRL